MGTFRIRYEALAIDDAYGRYEGGLHGRNTMSVTFAAIDRPLLIDAHAAIVSGTPNAMYLIQKTVTERDT